MKIIDNIDKDLYNYYIKKNPFLIKKIKNQTEEICLTAVSNYGCALAFVKKQTPEICLSAVIQDGKSLQYVKKQTPEICLAAVKQNGLALRFVKKQTPEICLAAIHNDADSLMYVKKQTDDLCLLALKKSIKTIEHIKNQTDEICIKAIKINLSSFCKIKNKSPAVCMFAVKKYGGLLEHISHDKQTPEICLAAVKQAAGAIIFSRFLDDAIVLTFLNVFNFKAGESSKIFIKKLIDAGGYSFILNELKNPKNSTLVFNMVNENSTLLPIICETLSRQSPDYIINLKRKVPLIFKNNFELNAIYERMLLERVVNNKNYNPVNTVKRSF